MVDLARAGLGCERKKGKKNKKKQKKTKKRPFFFFFFYSTSGFVKGRCCLCVLLGPS